MNAAEIAAARLLLEKRTDDAPFGLRLLARIEQAWRQREAERERAREACRRVTRVLSGTRT